MKYKIPKNIIRWLHLSDFHVGKDDYGERKLFEEILEHVRQQKEYGFVPDLIFVTGDVAYSGAANQYKMFDSKFLQPLYAIVGEEKKSCTFFVPGNHDVFRETHKYLDREATCKVDSHFFDPTPEGRSERQQVLPRFKAYTKNSYLIPQGWINSPAGSYAKPVEVRGTMIGVLGINTAWLSLDEKDRHKLSPGIKLLEDAFKQLQNCNLKIVLGHHPIGWFRDEQIQTIETILGNHNTLYLHGHLHKVRVNLEGDSFLYVQSGAAFLTRDDDKWVNGLLWAELDLARFVLRLQPRQWNPANLDWPIGMDLPEKRRVQGTDWWEFPLPRAAPPPEPALYPSELRYRKGIQPRYQEHVGFAGRHQEIQAFEQFLRSDDLVLNYHGISGVGKSWLLNHLLKNLSMGRIISVYRIAYVDCKEINGDLLAFMDRIARNIGEERLPSYISRRNKYYENSASAPLPQQWVDDLCDLLFFDLQTVSSTEFLVIFVDSFEKVQGTTLGFKMSAAVKDHFGGRPKDRFKVVIGSQEPIKSTQGWVRLRGVEIKPFSRKEVDDFAEKVLGTRDSSVIAYLADEWKGDPLELGQLVGLYRKDPGATSVHHLSQLRHFRAECIVAADSEFMKRLRERLGPEDTDALSCCAVPRWFDAPVLRTIANSDVATSRSQIKRLSQLWFVKRRTCGIGYEIHERYRGPLLRSLIQDDRDLFSKWSERCYEYLQARKTNDEGSRNMGREIESVCHLMTFNEKDALLQYNHLRYSFMQGRRVDLLAWLQDKIEAHLRFNPNISSVFRQWIQYGRAIILYLSGHDDAAFNEYEQMLKYPALDAFLKARVLRAKGDLLGWHGKRILQAKACYVEAVKLWEILSNDNCVSPGVNRDDTLKSLAETHGALARIEEIQGNLMEGMNHFHSALDSYRLCETLGPSYGRTLKWMARDLRLLGRWKEAHRRFNEAEDAFKTFLKKAASGDARLGKRVEEIQDRLQNVRNARAALWKDEGKWKKAKEVLTQVIAFHDNKPEKARNQEALGIALIDLGDVLRMEGNFIDANQVYKKAQASLQGSEVNKGYPLLGLAEVATVEGEEEKALEYLSQAEENFSKFDYSLKLGEVALCRAKLSRKVNIGEALENLEEAWKWLRKTTRTYTKSSVLVELTELAYESDRDSERCRDYRKQAIALAGQEQGPFAEHLARLRFLDGRIAGEEEPVDALPAFIESLAWAARHNTVTLRRTVSQGVVWLNDRLGARNELAPGKEETPSRKTEAVVRQSEEMALSALPEEFRAAFKDAVEELKRSLRNCVWGQA